MSQSSLLVTSKIPNQPQLLVTWSLRIRDRISAIGRNLISLESERQHLLSMLWEAGMAECEIEMDQCHPENVSISVDGGFRANETLNQQREPNESRGSIIDLISEDGTPESRKGFDAPKFTPAHACDATPRIESRDKENDGDFSNLDPRELSFALPPQPIRVHKPNEWELIDWEKVPIELLKEWMQFFGIKTTHGKAFMIRTLKEIFIYVSSEEAVGQARGSKEETFNEFSEVIREEGSLYEKIILYEPVEMSEVHALLRLKKKPHWQLSQASVREYLDLVGAHYSNTSLNSGGNFGAFLTRKRREPAHADDRKKQRRLRVSISAP